MIKAGIHQFCSEAKVAHTFYDEIKEQDIRAGDVYLVLNGQLDIELIDIIRVAKAKNLRIGHDVGIISYNEAPINEIILDGLTVLSTDFTEMGRCAAEMVRSGKLRKASNPFRLILTHTL
jgi:hypothetical protein